MLEHIANIEDRPMERGCTWKWATENGRVVFSMAEPRYHLEALLEGMTPEAMHAAFDWGPEVRHEIIE
jgi:hypothetical protein